MNSVPNFNDFAIKNAVPDEKVLSSSSVVFDYNDSVCGLDLEYEIYRNVFNVITSWFITKSRIVCVDLTSIQRLLWSKDEKEVEAGKVLYKILATCAGTDENGEINQKEVNFHIRW